MADEAPHRHRLSAPAAEQLLIAGFHYRARSLRRLQSNLGIVLQGRIPFVIPHRLSKQSGSPRRMPRAEPAHVR